MFICIFKPTLTNWFFFTVRSFIDAGTDILKTKAKLVKTPILYSHGDADPINSYQGTLKAYELTPSSDKEMKNWPGLYHECKSILILFSISYSHFIFSVHNETMPQRQEISEYYVNWIKKRCLAVKN